MPPDTENVCFWGKTGRDLPTVKTARLTQYGLEELKPNAALTVPSL
jgi:hypothetical protein